MLTYAFLMSGSAYFGICYEIILRIKFSMYIVNREIYYTLEGTDRAIKWEGTNYVIFFYSNQLIEICFNLICCEQQKTWKLCLNVLSMQSYPMK